MENLSKKLGKKILTDENAYQAGFPGGVLNDSHHLEFNLDLRDESNRSVSRTSKTSGLEVPIGTKSEFGQGLETNLSENLKDRGINKE